MFLRFNRRFKDGKEHRYWNIVENKRCAGGKVVQRQVLYLGEIKDSQHAAGVGRSKPLTKEHIAIPSCLCFRPIRRFPNTRKVMGCKFGSMRCNYIGRGNGARAGWLACSMNSWG